MPNEFSTNRLTRVIDSLITPAPFLLRTFFSDVQTGETEEIHFDTRNAKRRITPVVSPLVEGQVVKSKGWKTSTFAPGYVKDKRFFDPRRPLRRSPGEQIGGNLRPAERLERQITAELEDMRQMFELRLEVWAAEVLRTGKLVVEGNGYERVQLDFERHTDHTITLINDTRWTQGTSTPLQNLQTWALMVLKRSGAMPIDVVFDIDAWNLFASHAEVKDRLNTRRADAAGPIRLGGPFEEGGTFMGTIDMFNLWVYVGWYVNDSDVETAILPSKTVILTGPQIEGVQAFGAVVDEDADYRAERYFVKSWVEKDPARRVILGQAAPVIVPYRPNASAAVTVG